MPRYCTITDLRACYDENAKLNTRIFCVTVADVVKCGILENYVWKILNQHRQGLVCCWPHHKEGKTVYLHYDGLKDKYKALIKATLLDGKEPSEWYQENGRLNDVLKAFSSCLNDVYSDNFYKESIKFIETYEFADASKLSEPLKLKYKEAVLWLTFLKNNRSQEAIKELKYSCAADFWSDVRFVIEKKEINLPVAYCRLQEKVREYSRRGAICLISEKIGNGNTAKITEEGGNWLIARFASPVARLSVRQLLTIYNDEAAGKGWKQIKSVRTIEMFLNRSDVKPLWYGARYGELKAKEKFVRQHKTILPSCRDVLWYSDGTKLNLYYRNEKGEIATCQVYEVMDAYSEVFLGYHVSQTEDYQAQYNAFKMAIKVAGYKPYELRFDNQGGHRKLVSGDFLKRLSHLAIRTAPYNGKSKTIESAFGRFQQGYLRPWNSTGQNVTTKKIESKANVEFIEANKENLPSLKDAIDQYVKARTAWNKAPHPNTGIPRIQMYRNSQNTKAQKVEMWDIVDLFWIRSPKPVTYTASGISITINKHKYTYEVFDQSGMPDAEFLLRNVDRKFYLYYDAEDMSLVRLYTGDDNNLKYVTDAGPYLQIHRAIQEQDELDASFIRRQDIVNKEQRVRMQEKTEELMRKEYVHPEQYGLKMPIVKGVQKKQKKGKTQTVGSYQKEVSNMTEIPIPGRRSAYLDYLND